jgi:hypothetical protein
MCVCVVVYCSGGGVRYLIEVCGYIYAVIWLYSRRGKVYALGNTTLRSLLYNRINDVLLSLRQNVGY